MEDYNNGNINYNTYPEVKEKIENLMSRANINNVFSSADASWNAIFELLNGRGIGMFKWDLNYGNSLLLNRHGPDLMESLRNSMALHGDTVRITLPKPSE